MALAAEMQELEMQRMISVHLGFYISHPTTTRADNNAYELFSDHEGNFQQRRHINGENFFWGERIQKDSLRVAGKFTSKNVTDILTKVQARETLF